MSSIIVKSSSCFKASTVSNMNVIRKVHKVKLWENSTGTQSDEVHAKNLLQRAVLNRTAKEFQKLGKKLEKRCFG